MRSNASIVRLVLVSLVASCGSDIVCPGHLDPTPPPTMQIETVDGSRSIATAEVVEGPCSVAEGASFDAALGVRGVTVSRKLSGFGGDTSEPCIINVVSVDGRSVTVTATVQLYVSSSSLSHCADNSNCCSKAEVTSGTSERWEFTQNVIEVSFTDGVDAGYDAGIVDGGAIDGAID